MKDKNERKRRMSSISTLFCIRQVRLRIQWMSFAMLISH